jgi:hypothetical protein
MSVGDILDGAFKLLKANFKTITVITAVFVVPLQLVAAFAQRNVNNGRGLLRVLNDPTLARPANQNNASLIAALLAGLVALVTAPFIAGAISRVVAASYMGSEETAGPALRVTGHRFWALTASFVLVHVLEAIGFILCILPGIAVMTLYVMVAPAIVVEELGPLQGMRRSYTLARSRFWPTMGISLLAGVMSYFLGSLLATPFSIAALFIGFRWGWILLGLGGVLSALVSRPFVAIVATLLYFDARIRTEGFDLQVIAANLARQRATV